MKTLFLTSVGLPPETRDSFLSLLPKAAKDTKVAFVPTAADPDKDKWYVKSARDELIELGFQVQDVDLKGAISEVRDSIEKCDVLYVNGGNTFYLLDWVRKSKLDTYMGELLDNGLIYIGSSAGSIITGPDIACAGWDPGWDKDVVGMKDTTGLGYIDFAISPHFVEAERAILAENARKINYKIWPITDKQAILVKGVEVKLVGMGARIEVEAKKQP